MQPFLLGAAFLACLVVLAFERIESIDCFSVKAKAVWRLWLRRKPKTCLSKSIKIKMTLATYFEILSPNLLICTETVK